MLEFNMNEAQVLRKANHTIKQIAETIGKSERTVYYYLSETARSRKQRAFPSKLDPFKEHIRNILDVREDYNYNRVLLFEDLRKLGYEGGISILREYAKELAKKEAQKIYYRFETIPGHQAQVDWKECGKRSIEGKRVKVYAFTMTLGFSRKPFIVHTTTMKQSVMLASHILAFKYFGGIPKEILYDNMKTAFVYHPEKGFKPNRKLLTFANHYGFIPRRCQVRRPQTKGKVERSIGYYTGNFLPRIKSLELNLEEMNEKVLQWIEHISEKPIRELQESRSQRFEKEKEHLIPLPVNDYICDDILIIKVHGNSLIHYQTNRYSVPCKYIGMKLDLMVDPWGKTAQVFSGKEWVRTLTLNPKGSYIEEYRVKDKQELYMLCKKLQYKKLGPHSCNNRKNTDTQVEIRHPREFDQLVKGGEAV